jgi:antitoxin FitA
MATLTVRNLPNEALAKLRVQAAEHGRSMEAEARALIVAVAEGAQVLPMPDAFSLEERLAKVDAMMRETFGEHRPSDNVDRFLAERREEALREWEAHTK